MKKTLVCNVCGSNEAIGVACSACGPMSFAYCQRCAVSGREPYGAVVAAMLGIPDMDGVAAWFKPVLKTTLEAEGKSLEEFFQDVRRLEMK